MTLTPLQQYQSDLASHEFISDPAQQQAITILNQIYLQVIKPRSLFAALKKPMAMQGLYMWGKVGSGKTYLMDTFYNCLPNHLKIRSHFHEFMRQVHKRLKELQGHRNPLALVAKEFSKVAKVICFDEFFVNDIGDAMILGKLLEQLFSLGVVLITTSNIQPEDLYKDGLQRQRFLSTIALIKAHCQIVEVNNKVDYRLQAIPVAGRYFTPLDTTTARAMHDKFTHLAVQKTVHTEKLLINERELTVRAYTDNVLWVEFNELCAKPRNAEDYLQLAKKFKIILISHIPILSNNDNNAAKRFIYAVDVFYDQTVQLIISAAAPIDELYQGQTCSNEFKRTASRLHEMQSNSP